jgi:hypothetical protein
MGRNGIECARRAEVTLNATMTQLKVSIASITMPLVADKSGGG